MDLDDIRDCYNKAYSLIKIKNAFINSSKEKLNIRPM